MLGLQITTPAYFIIKFIIMFFKKLYRLSISNTTKIRTCYSFKPFNKLLVYELVKESHFFRSIKKYIVNYILKHRLCKIHIIRKVCKSYLRLYHPEFCSMSCGIGVLCPKGRSECIDILKCHRIGLTV